MNALKRHPKTIVLTIGHSTRTLEEFIGLLEKHDVSRVVDVRTVPRSAPKRCLGAVIGHSSLMPCWFMESARRTS
jgi:hypothetical protein